MKKIVKNVDMGGFQELKSQKLALDVSVDSTTQEFSMRKSWKALQTYNY
jgi:hypothetical protein